MEHEFKPNRFGRVRKKSRDGNRQVVLSLSVNDKAG